MIRFQLGNPPPAAETALPEAVTDSLTQHVLHCFAEARTAKEHITQRLLACDRARRGKYDPALMAEIRKTGGSEIFLMLTDIKCRAAQAWIKDVFMSAGQDSWGFDATPEPDLPGHIKSEIIETAVAEMQQIAAMGVEIHPMAMSARIAEIGDEITAEIRETAQEAAERMQRRCQDILAEAKWSEVMEDVIDDFVTYPTAFIKGPVAIRKKQLKWSEDWTPVVTTVPVRSFHRVSPYDIFPSPMSTDLQEGYVIERVRFSRADLQGMMGAPGYSTERIQDVLATYGSKGHRLQLSGDSDRDHLDGHNYTTYSRGIIEGLVFWGSVPGSMLTEWGMAGVEPYVDYEVSLIVVGRHTIKVSLNPDPLGRRPYSCASFIRTPGSVWGRALPESMDDVQSMCNASARALQNNMAIASGPQVEVQVDRLPPGEDLTNMYPWKIWQTTSDKTGGGQGAIRFFQPAMNAEALLAIMAHFARMADEVTGVPNYIYGSTAVSGAGRTSSGLAMLMENAAKGIKDAILALDRAIVGVIGRLFEHLMLYDPDQSIKGDMHLVPRGVVASLIKESVEERRIAFLQQTANPFDAQIMGIKGRAALLRKMAERLEMGDDVVPSEKDIEIQEAQAQAQAQAQALLAAQGGLPAPAMGEGVPA